MPYDIVKSGSRWSVISKDTGKVHGKHSTRDEASAQMRAMYANMSPGDKKKMASHMKDKK